MKARCLYETCLSYFGLGSFGAPAVPFSSDALGMPWEFMVINRILWDKQGNSLVFLGSFADQIRYMASICRILVNKTLYIVL